MNNFLSNKSLLRDLLFQGDQWHTINGGVANIKLTRTQNSHGISILARVPGVDAESYKVAIDGSSLRLHVNLSPKLGGSTERFQIPMHMRTMDIPTGVDVERIDATHSEEGVTIWMPFTAGWDGDLRSLNIRKAE